MAGSSGLQHKLGLTHYMSCCHVIVIIIKYLGEILNTKAGWFKS